MNNDKQELKACPAIEAAKQTDPSAYGEAVLRGKITDMQDACADCSLRRTRPATDSAVVEALRGMLDEYNDRRSQFGNDVLWTKHEDAGAIDNASRLIAAHDAIRWRSKGRNEQKAKGNTQGV